MLTNLRLPPYLQVLLSIGYTIEEPAPDSKVDQRSKLKAIVSRRSGGEPLIRVYQDKIEILSPTILLENKKQKRKLELLNPIVIKIADLQMLDYTNGRTQRQGIVLMNRETSKQYVFENVRGGFYCPKCYSTDVDYCKGGTEGHDYLDCHTCKKQTDVK